MRLYLVFRARHLLVSALVLVALSLLLFGLPRLSWPRPADWGKRILASVLPIAEPNFGGASWPWAWEGKSPVDPQSWLEAQMPLLSASRGAAPVLAAPYPAEEAEEEEVAPPPGTPLEPVNPGLPLTGQARKVKVFIYTTHNAESYQPDYGVVRVPPGTAGGVTRAAVTLASALEEEGVPAVLSPAIHDYPELTGAYARSEVTVKAALAAYPNLSVIIDVHRDAGNRPVTAVIEGREVAQILLVVGSDQRLPHPDWRKNLAFARQVEAKMQELYPGLSRGVRVQSGRYNQHLHPRALLVEIGNQHNTLDQVEAAARLLARVLKEVV
ncbi:MAG: stage II sporulation protein P [Moorellales bacterium]